MDAHMNFITRRCDICLEQVPVAESERPGYEHVHCYHCIQANAARALGSTAFELAKCCKVFPLALLEQAGALTGNGEMVEYTRKLEEHTDPRNKVYCHDQDCSKFIPNDSRTRRVGTCSCGKKTCKSCDQEKLREVEENGRSLRQLADRKGWRCCPNCLTVIEKTVGCNKVECTCGQHFCYRCGEPFYSQFNPHHCPAVNQG
ncbi:uncharacterized protein F4822DRAFT_431492 [Hypoxylon trugodes]|uniref:uncharacterized protein n=1 Tax=Hypoxylon trugodes TaxID=326681 RepID=UPI002198E8C0|nr:uncharacterized protein F4822DRAFT_431492 [Hypoxylon trugodes]KAI1386622.1 hypothetical protein F4822DRAFT_431492 [Hypoxylon trugodes]